MSVSSLARAMIMLLVLSAVAPLLSACNTAAGLGQDTSAAGNAVTKSAKDVKQGL